MYKFLLLSKKENKPKGTNKKEHTEREEIKDKAGLGGAPRHTGTPRGSTARQRPQRDPTHRRQSGKLLFLF